MKEGQEETMLVTVMEDQTFSDITLRQSPAELQSICDTVELKAENQTAKCVSVWKTSVSNLCVIKAPLNSELFPRAPDSFAFVSSE